MVIFCQKNQYAKTHSKKVPKTKSTPLLIPIQANAHYHKNATDGLSMVSTL